MADSSSRPDDSAIELTHSRPAAVQRVLRKRELCRQRLVDLDAESGAVVWPHRPVTNLGRAGKDGARLLAEDVLLLDAEVPAGQVECQVRGVANRRDIAGAVPGGADTEQLAVRRQLASRCQ